MEAADQSTFMHEMAHNFLFDLEHIAGFAPESRYAKDLAVIREWASWVKGAVDEYAGTSSAAEIDASHKGQGWTCIGYHYVIRKDGTVEQGRPHWTVGAHAYGHNSHTIGIHVCGNFEIGEPTDAQIESLAMLLANLCTDYGLPIDRDHIVGHRELISTACPGKNLYEMMDTIVGKANFYAEQ